MSEGITPRRKGKKIRLKKLPFVILGLVLLLILVVVFIKSSYNSGLDLAARHGQKHVNYDFNEYLIKMVNQMF